MKRATRQPGNKATRQQASLFDDHATLIDLGEIRYSSQVRHPFSLTCYGCDAGDGIDSPEQALLEGWSEIREDDGPAWNYLGVCPDCDR